MTFKVPEFELAIVLKSVVPPVILCWKAPSICPSGLTQSTKTLIGLVLVITPGKVVILLLELGILCVSPFIVMSIWVS